MPEKKRVLHGREQEAEEEEREEADDNEDEETEKECNKGKEQENGNSEDDDRETNPEGRRTLEPLNSSIKSEHYFMEINKRTPFQVSIR